jgi:hypothetical protein
MGKTNKTKREINELKKKVVLLIEKKKAIILSDICNGIGMHYDTAKRIMFDFELAGIVKCVLLPSSARDGKNIKRKTWVATECLLQFIDAEGWKK